MPTVKALDERIMAEADARITQRLAGFARLTEARPDTTAQASRIRAAM
jgi:hypothetical protein